MATPEQIATATALVATRKDARNTAVDNYGNAIGGPDECTTANDLIYVEAALINAYAALVALYAG